MTPHNLLNVVSTLCCILCNSEKHKTQQTNLLFKKKRIHLFKNYKIRFYILRNKIYE